MLFRTWRRWLEMAGVQFKEDLSLIEYLSRAPQRLAWQGHALPSDDLCVENAIILEHATNAGGAAGKGARSHRYE